MRRSAPKILPEIAAMSNVAIMEPGEPERRNTGALTPLVMLNRAMETGATWRCWKSSCRCMRRWEASNARKAF